jgi:hypothetical protein|tara:strand:+ start:41534 stop:41734 length:201 start_codon:yes stop_codon:yes gene_type:complete
MTPTERIADIKGHLEKTERHMRKMHKSMEEGLAEHGHLLGLSEGDVTAFSGGSGKLQPPPDGDTGG